MQQKLADVLTDICVDGVLAIKQGDKPVDLHMIELMEMQHKTETDTSLVKGKRNKTKLESCILLFILDRLSLGPWIASSRYAKELEELLHLDL